MRSHMIDHKTLTPEQEQVAGKLSGMGRRLERIKSKVEREQGRDVGEEEWAALCGITVEKLRKIKYAQSRLITYDMSPEMCTL